MRKLAVEVEAEEDIKRKAAAYDRRAEKLAAYQREYRRRLLTDPEKAALLEKRREYAREYMRKRRERFQARFERTRCVACGQLAWVERSSGRA